MSSLFLNLTRKLQIVISLLKKELDLAQRNTFTLRLLVWTDEVNKLVRRQKIL